MFKIAVENAKNWKNSIDAIVNLIDEGVLEITSEGVSLRAMDPSQIAMVCFSVPKSSFLSYEIENSTKIGLNFDSYSKILGRTRGNEQLEMIQDENKLALKFLSEKKKRSFKIPLIDLPSSSQREPTIKHDAVVKVKGGHFKEMLKDAALVSSHVTLQVNDDKFYVEVHGDSADLKTESEKESDDVLEINASEKARATFPLQYLEDIVKACPDSQIMGIHLKNNAPVKIDYEIDAAQLTYYLAPRIEEE